MDVVFAKAAPSPKHHYSRLLHKEPAEDFFEAKQAASPRLYTARGVTKGHRRTSSEVPPEAPTSPPVKPAEAEGDLDESLSSRAVETIRQKKEVYDEVVVLIRKLKSERDEAKEDAKASKEEVQNLKLALEEAELRRRETEAECARLRSQLPTSKLSPRESPRLHSESPPLSPEGRDRKLTRDPAKRFEIAQKRGKEPPAKAKPGKPKTSGFVLK